MLTDWRKTEECFIKRDELILDPNFVESYKPELGPGNHGNTGRSYKFAPTSSSFYTAVRILYSTPYHNIEGFTRAFQRLVP